MNNPCPKCHQQWAQEGPVEPTECPKCGVIFAKFYAAQEQKQRLEAERVAQAKVEADAKAAREAKAAAKAAAKVEKEATKAAELASRAKAQEVDRNVAMLSTCPACGGTVAIGARACPHCGKNDPAPAPAPAIKKPKKSIVWAAAALIAFVWVATPKSPSALAPTVGSYERCPSITPAALWLPKGHEAVRDDFIAKAYWLNANGQCVLDGSYGEQTRKYYFSVRPLGEKHAKHVRFTRDELRP